MGQHELTRPSDLLDARGHLVQQGWARRPLLGYDRSAVAAGWHRLKEWDYYAVCTDRYGVTFTAADLGYLGLFAVVWLDFERGTCAQREEIRVLPRGRALGEHGGEPFPTSSEEGDVVYRGRRLSMRFERRPGARHLVVAFPGFDGGADLHADLVLEQPEPDESTVIATSWAEDRRAFYYNQKVNCMPARGEVRLGDQAFSFEPDAAMGVLDWGRGVWTWRNRWYWSSASFRHQGRRVGWNLGYGFSDRTPASENTVLVDGRVHKLDEVTFHIPRDARGRPAYTEPWQVSSSDGRCELQMRPLVDRSGRIDLLLARSIQHQVFGRFSGRLVLDDGEVLEITDVLGFAEDVLNWW